nr:glycosyltransferase family 4 protein [Porphyrobacter sp. GA68]
MAAARSLVLSQRHREQGLRGWFWSLFHLAEALALATMLRRTGTTRLHSHFANSGATVGMIAADHLSLPWSLTLHGISETDAPAGALLPDKVRRAEFVACASWFMRAQAMRSVEPEHWGKLHIVRCGVSPAASAVPAGSVRRLVTVGRLSAEKGYPGLFEALSMISDKIPSLTLEVIGDGPLREALQAQVQSTRLTHAVTFLGALQEEDTLRIIAAADGFVLPSLMEGLPVVLMEAMAAGKPVIAPAVAGIPELVRDNDTGLLFRPGDWRQLAEQMHRLCTDDLLASNLARNGRRKVLDEFTIDEAVVPLKALFENRVGI